MMMLPPFPISFLPLVLFLPLLTPNAAVSPASSTTTDATGLLAFKSKADPRNCLPYNSSSHLCIWEGVQCSSQQRHQRVTKLILQDLPLSGIFPPNTLSLLDQLRVLSLQNLSLSGPIPDLSTLRNLKSLFLDHNSFSGSFPPSLTLLHRLKTLDLSQNNLTGPLPGSLNSLDRLNSLNLQFNRFNGPLPRLNHSYLVTFNISYNNLTGPIPVTPTLLRFDPSSFASNPGLCGKIVHKECRPGSPFFGATPVESGSSPPPTAAALGQSEELHGVDEPKRPVSDNRKKHKTTEVIVVFCAAVFVLVCSLLCFVVTIKRKRRINDNQKECYSEAGGDVTVGATSESRAVMHMELQGSELEEKVKRVQQAGAVEKSGSLVFCAGEAQLYTLDQLMRASAELLGRGTMGTTYKAVLDNRLIVGVKRLDAGKLRGTGKEVFERHMESVGGLRHPNLVPVRAYFQGKDERLLIYDYQPNGSLLSLIHGSKSSRAKPLHWTSCLKIAEDIAQGISYIHQAWRLVHGNLKSSNVLLGPDFEACVSDYCLSILAQNSDDSDHQDPDAATYIAPEITAARNHQHQAQPTSKSDVYSFGILLMELLTGKPPSQLPDLAPDEMVTWVRFVREEFDTGGGGDADNDKLEMLVEVAIGCSLASPEQRPTMWQVLKMLQEIKEAVLVEDRDQSDPPQIDSTAAS